MASITNKQKVIKALLIIIVFFSLLFLFGVLMYKYAFKMSTINAIYNTSLSISSTGIDDHPRTSSEKIFIAFFSMVCSLLFLSIAGAIIGFIVASYYK